MIEGLKITISSPDLVKLLNSVAARHKKKSESYGNSSGEHRKYKAKAEYFGFLAEHVIPHDEYLLSESDLRKLGILTWEC